MTCQIEFKNVLRGELIDGDDHLARRIATHQICDFLSCVPDRSLRAEEILVNHKNIDIIDGGDVSIWIGSTPAGTLATLRELLNADRQFIVHIEDFDVELLGARALSELHGVQCALPRLCSLEVFVNELD